MRIKALRVDHYGPLGEFSDSGMAGFNLVYAPNEEGKTLLIDAILRLLFKKDLRRNAKVFGNISRVKEPPEGFVVLEVDGDEIKLDRDESVTKYIPITPADFRNIFVVRDSDLSIVNPGMYFTDVTEKLAGLQTSEINRIKKVLQAKGRLTSMNSSSDLANSVESGHIRRKVEEARELIEEARQLRDELAARDFERLEQDLAETCQTLGKHEQELELLRTAQLREKYLETGSQLDELKRVVTSLDGVAVFNEDDLSSWIQLSHDHKRFIAELEDAGDELVRCQDRVAEIGKTLAEKKAGVDAMRERQRRIEDLLEPLIYAYESLRRERAARRARENYWKWGAVLAGGASLLALLGVVLHPTVFIYALTTALLVATGVFARQLFLSRSSKVKLAATWDDLSLQAARLGFDVVSVDGLLQAKGHFEREFDEARRVVDALSVDAATFRRQIESLEKQVRDGRQDIAGVERKVADLKMNAGVDEVGDYRLALRQKSELMYQRRSLEAFVRQSLGDGGQEDTIAYWETRLARLLGELPEDTGINYDARREDHVRELVAGLTAKKRKIEEALTSGRQALRDFEAKVNGVGIAKNAVCRTSGELERLERLHGEFIDSVIECRDDARQALAILEEIEAEEKTKVVELFGEGTSVSAYFRRITAGRYAEVRFDPAELEISVVTRDGTILPADKLSGGAFDQLYLAIRLSIAERMLDERRGFFIFDDPFIKSDMDRLKYQLRLLQTIAASGWQVVYFSAKKEVYDILKPDITARRIRLIALHRQAAAPMARPAEKPSAPYPVDLFSDGATY